MNLYLWAIRSNGFGLPYSGRGQIGHIVLTGDDPNMPVVLELSGGGRYPGYDCCPSATRSALRYFGLTDPGAVRVEELEQTAPPLGTFISNVPAAARALGMSSSNVQFGTPPGPYIMNPMLDHIVPRTPDYDANSQGVYVIFSGVSAVPVASNQPISVAGATPMTPQQAYALAMSHFRDLYVSLFHREPANQDALDQWAKPYAAKLLASDAPGCEGVDVAFLTTPEALANLAAESAGH